MRNRPHSQRRRQPDFSPQDLETGESEALIGHILRYQHLIPTEAKPEEGYQREVLERMSVSALTLIFNKIPTQVESADEIMPPSEDRTHAQIFRDLGKSSRR